MKKKVSKLKIAIVILVVLICAALIAMLVPAFKFSGSKERLATYIESFGIWGVFVLLFIQIMQIVVAIVPGELVELAAGVLYGWGLGTVICIVGIVIGQYLVFKLVKWFGTRFSNRMVSQKEFEKFKFLNDEKKLEYVIFILFFIPGTPKDVLTYFVPFTKIGLKRFLFLTAIARVPSVLSSTYVGATFVEGNIWQAVIIYAIIGAISIPGIYIHNKFIKKGEKNGRK